MIHRMARSFAILGATTAVVIGLPGIASADGPVPDPGLEVNIPMPVVDISEIPLDQAGEGGCRAAVTFTSRTGRAANQTSVTESMNATATTTCSGMTLSVHILDHDPLGASPDKALYSSGFYSGKKASRYGAQTVSWALPTAPTGLRPVSEVTYTARVSSHGAANCLRLHVVVLAGYAPTADIQPCT